MFVMVTVVGVSIGWLVSELKFVRDRQALLDWAADETHIIKFVHFAPPHPTVPFWRIWLGDRPKSHVLLPFSSTKAVVERAEALFPEALWIEVEESGSAEEPDEPEESTPADGAPL